MAIDDNETYGLTGAQVKDLASKVKGKPDALVVYIDNRLANNTTVKAYSNAALTTAIESGQIYTAFNAGRPVVLFWQSTIQFTPDWTYSIVSADTLGSAVDLYASYSNTTYLLSSDSLTSNSFICSTQVLATTTQLTNGSVTKVGTSTVGGTATPVYLNSGTPTAVSKPASGSWFKGVPDISSGGVMEVGKYIDFHNANADTSDFAVRLQTQGNNQATVNLPTSSGTLALTSQLPSGNNSSYIQIGSVLIQWGKKTVTSATSNTTVSLPQSYGNTNYEVIVSCGFNESGQSFWWACFTSKANQSFTCRAGYKQVNAAGGGGTSSGCEVNWITIGVKS